MNEKKKEKEIELNDFVKRLEMKALNHYFLNLPKKDMKEKRCMDSW